MKEIKDTRARGQEDHEGKEPVQDHVAAVPGGFRIDRIAATIGSQDRVQIK